MFSGAQRFQLAVETMARSEWSPRHLGLTSVGSCGTSRGTATRPRVGRHIPLAPAHEFPHLRGIPHPFVPSSPSRTPRRAARRFGLVSLHQPPHGDAPRFPAERSRMMRRVVTTLALIALCAAPALAANQVRISQVYGGGGATSGTPTYNQDYVEIFNSGTTAVNIGSWQIAYGSAAGNWAGA